MKALRIAGICLLLFTPATTHANEFPAGKRKEMKKGDTWNVHCMDMEITVREVIIQTGEKPVNFGQQATIICNTANKAKAYFSCPAGAEAGGDPPEVFCK